MSKYFTYTKEQLLGRQVGPETSKTFEDKLDNGFWAKYASGDNILEIGYEGNVGAEPLFPHVIGIDKDYPGYNGIHLPFADFSQDTVYASHVLEHIQYSKTAIQEWYRVLKIGGYLIIVVPHVWLYEKKPDMPSRYNDDHKRFYSPWHLLQEVFESLPHLGYRIRHLIDNDKQWKDNFVPYDTPKQSESMQGRKLILPGEMYHSDGCYEIELVLEKTMIPSWVQYSFANRRTLGRD